MAQNHGYIGRAPGDSSVKIARQTNTSSGVTTNFTFSSGYEIGFLDVYLNGVKLINTTDYQATDGSTISLTTAAIDGDALEFVAYKAFNVVQPVNNTNSLIVSGNLTANSATITTNLSVGSSITGATFFGDGSGLTGIANTANIKSDTIDTGSLNVTGLSTFRNTVLIDGDTKLDFNTSSGQEGQIFATNEYLYINSSADNGVFVQTNGFIELKKGSGSDKYIEMNSHPNHNGEVSLYYDGNKKLETTNNGVVITGVATATSFSGSGANLTNLPPSGDSLDITASLFI